MLIRTHHMTSHVSLPVLLLSSVYSYSSSSASISSLSLSPPPVLHHIFPLHYHSSGLISSFRLMATSRFNSVVTSFTDIRVREHSNKTDPYSFLCTYLPRLALAVFCLGFIVILVDWFCFVLFVLFGS
jgi:hypothetical protein